MTTIRPITGRALRRLGLWQDGDAPNGWAVLRYDGNTGIVLAWYADRFAAEQDPEYLADQPDSDEDR